MYTDRKIWLAQSDKNLFLLPSMANRHGLIAGATGTGKTITLTEKVDPSVLGGLRLDLGGTRLDGTVQGRLERLRNEISGVVI